MARILLADNDEQELELARRSLSGAGFEVSICREPLRTFDRTKAENPDLLLLGFSAPTSDRLEICQRIKAGPATWRIPVIMLSTASERMDSIRGFEVGAVDCITKPLNPVELVLRVRRSLVPGPGFATVAVQPAALRDSLQVGGLTIDYTRRTVFVEGREVHLTSTEYDLLRLLTTSNGRALRREEVLRSVWGDHVGLDSRTLDTHIRRLRSKLESAARLITTIHGFGYRFETDL